MFVNIHNRGLGFGKWFVQFDENPRGLATNPHEPNFSFCFPPPRHPSTIPLGGIFSLPLTLSKFAFRPKFVYNKYSKWNEAKPSCVPRRSRGAPTTFHEKVHNAAYNICSAGSGDKSLTMANRLKLDFSLSTNEQRREFLDNYLAQD